MGPETYFANHLNILFSRGSAQQAETKVSISSTINVIIQY